MSKWLLVLLPFLAIAAGCMSPEDRLVGKWRGKVEMGEQAKGSPMGNIAGFSNMIEPQLDLRPDKTFTLTLSYAPIDGTWKLNDHEIVLTPTKVMGMNASDVRKKAEKEIDRAQTQSPFPLPFMMGAGSALTGTKEMHVEVGKNYDNLSLDPATGTLLAGFGKISFTKV